MRAAFLLVTLVIAALLLLMDLAKVEGATLWVLLAWTALAASGGYFRSEWLYKCCGGGIHGDGLVVAKVSGLKGEDGGGFVSITVFCSLALYY